MEAAKPVFEPESPEPGDRRREVHKCYVAVRCRNRGAMPQARGSPMMVKLPAAHVAMPPTRFPFLHFETARGNLRALLFLVRVSVLFLFRVSFPIRGASRYREAARRGGTTRAAGT